MNIFVTDKCPVESARALDDKRVIKMCLESAQMLCTALSHYGADTPYKATHANHPCSVWARLNRSNWLWLWNHGMALCAEYTNRYEKIHKCQGILEGIKPLSSVIPQGELTMFVNCARNKSLGIDYMGEPDVFIAYQQYLADRWDHDKRPPAWYGVAK